MAVESGGGGQHHVVDTKVDGQTELGRSRTRNHLSVVGDLGSVIEHDVGDCLIEEAQHIRQRLGDDL